MGIFKAIAIDFGRKLLRDAGLEQDFLNRLSPEDRSAYATTFVVSWIDPDFGGRLLEAMAPVLYPKNAIPLFEFGQRMAIDNLNGLYKFILRFFTIEQAVGSTAKLWSTYHKQGIARTERVNETRALLIVDNYPTLPKTIRDVITGYIAGLVSLTGAKDVHVRHDESNPTSWRWTILWG
jgi:hypothetical protein